MTDLITLERLLHIFPQMKDPDNWVPALNSAFQKFNVIDPNVVAGVLAVCGSEMGGFVQGCIREYLTYSPARAFELFPKARANPQDTYDRCARGQVVFANWIYANLYGNGDEASGHGWFYRGGGINGLTFKGGYEACKAGIGVDVVKDPDLISSPPVAALAAVWFMAKLKPAMIPHFASGDESDFLAGAGMNGWTDESATQRRLLFWHRGIDIFRGQVVPVSSDLPHRYLYQGCLPGGDVRTLQAKLKERGFYMGTLDPFFGPLLKAAVIAFQRATFPDNPYDWDGIVGIKTMAALS